MFGSLIAAKAIYGALSADATITGTVDTRIVHGLIVPEGVDLPAFWYWMEDGQYSGPIDSDGSVSAEVCTFHVRIAIPGDSHGPIMAAANRQRELLSTLETHVEYDDTTYLVLGNLVGETRPHIVEPNDARFASLGNIYRMEIYTGG